MRGYIGLVATGPELSKSLNEQQARDAMSIILSGQIDPVQAGIFLIALRMKRETDAENAGVLAALENFTHRATTSAEEIVVIADPFNGYLRGIPATPFLPAVVAACGMPACIHGVAEAGPKYGITTNMVLAAAGRNVGLGVGDAGDALDSADCGWAYVDQSSYIPPLHELVPLRDRMVKRTCISTIEVLLRPLSGKRSTHLVTGFVHKAYPPVYARLAKQAGYTSSAIIRGVEGGCIPSLSQLSRYFSSSDGEQLSMHKLVPSACGIARDKRAISVPDQFLALTQSTGLGKSAKLAPLLAYAVKLGEKALDNEPGPMYDCLIYGAAITLFHAGRARDIAEAAAMAREAIASGDATDRFYHSLLEAGLALR